ncbi:MAG: hypothetical protein GY847_07670 [Proteobacteria bacterium]|nr:hypothetical protein [Pseudomonadota bacterium]
MTISDRRVFLKQLAAFTGGAVIAPVVVSCAGASASKQTTGNVPITKSDPVTQSETSGLFDLPLARPQGWDPVSFNRDRGSAGSIPETYLNSIKGPDGIKKHLGKHLPYIPKIDSSLVPKGYIPIMWGDPSMGYTSHPNSPKGDEAYPIGHWYNWVRIRKATEKQAEEADSIFSNWPAPEDEDSGRFEVFGDADITENSGKNTIYLAALPSDVNKGDIVRIHGHCLYHGEYIDFIEL